MQKQTNPEPLNKNVKNRTGKGKGGAILSSGPSITALP